MSASRSKKRIVIKIHDYDDSIGQLAKLLNKIFLKFISDKNVDIKQVLKTFIDTSPYGKTFTEQANDPSIEKIIFANGSARQNISLDVINRINHFIIQHSHDDGSVFHFLQTFSDFLATLFPGKIAYDKRTISDIWHGKALGTEYKTAEEQGYFTQAFYDNMDGLASLHKHLEETSLGSDFYEKYKIVIIYALLHSFTKDHPEYDELVFEFYDDNSDICRAVSAAFTQFPELLPKKLILSVFSYELFAESTDNYINTVMKTAPSEVARVSGKGEIDDDLTNSIKKFHQCLTNNKLASQKSVFSDTALFSALQEFSNFLSAKKRGLVISTQASLIAEEQAASQAAGSMVSASVGAYGKQVKSPTFWKQASRTQENKQSELEPSKTPSLSETAQTTPKKGSLASLFSQPAYVPSTNTFENWANEGLFGFHF